MAAMKCPHPHIPAARIKRAPILTLFFIWRLSGKPRHAYSLINDIYEVGFIQCKPSTVYALLASMERAGLVASKIKLEEGRPRRLYSSTAKGKKVLSGVKRAHVKGIWREFVTELLSTR